MSRHVSDPAGSRRAAVAVDAERSSLHRLRERFDRSVRRTDAVCGEHAERRRGSVTLVGAGPGGADLVTVRGARALARADVVVYDRLADPELLDLAPRGAELIAVGKAKGWGPSQEEINTLIVERALRGSCVVRLKGGDPFVFGRGSEEYDAVVAAGLGCDVVPGLSSALAGPALAGIPLTHRGVSASFTVLSGHRVAERDHDWDALARSGSTLVVLMGATTARAIAARLIVAGRSEGEAVALVHRAGRSDARTVRTTLGDLRDLGCPLPAPVVIVVGAVAAMSAVSVGGPTDTSPTDVDSPVEGGDDVSSLLLPVVSLR